MDSADLQKNYMGGYNKLMEAYRGSGVQQTIDTMNRAIRDSDNERTREYLLRIQHWNLKVMDLEDVRISLNTKLKTSAENNRYPGQEIGRSSQHH